MIGFLIIALCFSVALNIFFLVFGGRQGGYQPRPKRQTKDNHLPNYFGPKVKKKSIKPPPDETWWEC